MSDQVVLKLELGQLSVTEPAKPGEGDMFLQFDSCRADRNLIDLGVATTDKIQDFGTLMGEASSGFHHKREKIHTILFVDLRVHVDLFCCCTVAVVTRVFTAQVGKLERAYDRNIHTCRSGIVHVRKHKVTRSLAIINKGSRVQQIGKFRLDRDLGSTS